MAKSLFIAVMLLTASLSPSLAAWREVNAFGDWRVLEDYDEAFGTLGYAARAAADDPADAYNLNVNCVIEPDHSSLSVSLFRIAEPFSASGGALPVTFRFGQEEARSTRWQLSRDGQTLFFNDGEGTGRFSDAYMADVEAAKTGSEPVDRLFQGVGYADDVSWFAWSLMQVDTLALLISADGDRQRIILDVTGARDALNDMFGRCFGTLDGPAADPREEAKWQTLAVRAGMYKSIAFGAGTCLELEVVKSQPGAVLSVNDFTSSKEFTRLKFPAGQAILSGPKQRLEIYFDQGSGQFRSRSWKASQC